ncbi:MAG: RtcB family protein, partial [Terriglobia bacterium]
MDGHKGQNHIVAMKLELSQLKKFDDFRYLIPRGIKPGMKTDALVYADEELLSQILGDLSLEQAINVAFLPGIVGRSLAMPDIHQGYGFPIGGVAATDPAQGGVISPGGVGFDINCGVRLLASSASLEEVRPKIKELVHQLFRDIPCGTGTKGNVPCSMGEIDRVLTRGARWVVEKGFGERDDLTFSEEEGQLAGADPDACSKRAKQRGVPQIGTLGSGNHFIEVQYVEKIFEPEIAARFGLRPNQIVVLIHSGSRGFGHQVCTDYLQAMNQAMRRYQIELPDRQLACVPVHSPEGRDYLAAMNAAANYAWANRQAMTHFTRRALQRVLGPETEVRVVYDVAHNIAKRERHVVDGKEREVLVHRKGATRAFPAGRPEVPEVYRDVGQPVLIPGSMGTASYVLVGTEKAMEETFGTVCHGAGRRMSRSAAKRSEHARDARQRLAEQGIYVKSETREGIAEEIPEAYKDIDAV